MPEAQESDQVSLYGKSPEDKSKVCEIVDYFISATVLIGFLACLGKHAAASSLAPIFILLFVYAAPVALVAAYRTVVEKYYSQPKFKKGSKTAMRLCGRWRWRLMAYMLLACFSAMAFAISAPSWGMPMWVFMALAVIGFYPVCRFVYRKTMDHCDPAYAKMKAIQISVLIVGVVTSLLYAVIPTVSFSGSPETFIADLEARHLYFYDSGCLLFLEIEKLTSYSDFLTKYGWGYVLDSAFLAAFAVKIALSVSVFLGIANMLGFCMLDRHERLSVFRLMPEYGEISEAQKWRFDYLLCLLAVWALVSGALWMGERAVEREAFRAGPSLVDALLEEATDYLAVLPYLPTIKEEAALYEDYRDAVDEIKREYGPALDRDVDAYYDACLANVGGYVDWCESTGGSLSRTFAFVGAGFAAGNFNDVVAEPVDRAALDARYAEYAAKLAAARSDWQAARVAAGLEQGSDVLAMGGETLAEPLDLWPDWSSAAGSEQARQFLLGAGSDEDAKARVEGFIEAQRTRVLSEIDNLAEIAALEEALSQL